MMTIWAFVVMVVMKRISDKCFFFQSSYQSKKSQNATKRHLFLLYQKLLRSMGDNAGNPHGPRQDGPPQIGGTVTLQVACPVGSMVALLEDPHMHQ